MKGRKKLEMGSCSPERQVAQTSIWGGTINWDSAKEQIIGDPEASKHLSRPYRAPWIYPM